MISKLDKVPITNKKFLEFRNRYIIIHKYNITNSGFRKMFGIDQTQVYDFSNQIIYDLDTKTVVFNIHPSNGISSELVDKDGIENFNEYITDNHDLIYNMPKNRLRMDRGIDNVYAIDNAYLLFVTYKTANNTRMYINENLFYNFKKNDAQKLKRFLKIKELNG